MTLQIDGKFVKEVEGNILRSVIIPGKICNLITREPERIVRIDQEDGKPVKIYECDNPYFNDPN